MFCHLHGLVHNNETSLEELDARILEMLERNNGTWKCKVCGKVGKKSHMQEHEILRKPTPVMVRR